MLVNFTPEQRRYLTTAATAPTGGPPLELSAWFAAPFAPGDIVRRLCRDGRAFGPCSIEPGLFGAELERGEASGEIALDGADARCIIVLEAPTPGRGGRLIQVAEYHSFRPIEVNACLRPDTASLAMGCGDWHAAENTFGWSHPDAPEAMIQLYQRLAAWWGRQLAGAPGCIGLWLGYEGCDDGAREVALRHPGHLITEQRIAESGAWPHAVRIDRLHAGIALDVL